MNSFLLICDAAMLDPLLFLRGVSCIGPVPLAFRMSNVGFPLFLRSSAHSGSALLALSTVRLGLLPSVMDLSSLDFSMLLQGVAHPESQLLAVSFESLESILLLQSSAQLGFFLFLLGTACMDPLLPASDLLEMGFLPLVRSLARLDPALSVCGAASIGLTLSLHSYAHLGVRTPSWQNREEVFSKRLSNLLNVKRLYCIYLCYTII